jgi:hypothetical protein
MKRRRATTAAEDSAYAEGKLAAVREQREGGYACPYRNGPRRAAWSRGLAAGREEVSDHEHRARVAAVPVQERDANKAATVDMIQAWLAKQGRTS